uniref:Sorbitol dehydrogenase n=1 Tax=Ditylenchus dipsaci TaxID=166011 RepID=A0A915DGL8_9BILA
MSIDNLSAVIHGKNDLRIEQRPIPVANANQLLIRIHTVGICGSDVHYLNHGAMGACPIREPLVLGHEASGIVVEVGKNVQGFSVGDRVALEPSLSCKKCFQCLEKRDNLCLNTRFFGSSRVFPHVHGTLTKYVAHTPSCCFNIPFYYVALYLVTSSWIPTMGTLFWLPSFCLPSSSVLPPGYHSPGYLPPRYPLPRYPSAPPGRLTLGYSPPDYPLSWYSTPTYPPPGLPEHVSMEEGALLEPLNVAVHACRRAGLKPGQNVLICGAGPIGILNLLTARALGAKSVLLTDIDEKRLALAQDLGADHILNVAGKTPAETAKSVQELFKCQPEVSIECTGVPQSIETAILTTQSGGVVVLVGLGPNRMELPILDAAAREVDIRGVFRYSNCYPTALELVANGRINLKSVTKAHYSLKNHWMHSKELK